MSAMVSQAFHPVVRASVPPSIGPSIRDEPDDSPIGRRVLDQLHVGIAVLSENGSVVFCNAHARRLTDAREAVATDARGRLYFLDDGAQRTYRNALGQFAHCDMANDDGSVTILANRPLHPERPLVVSLRAMPAPAGNVLATLSDLSRQMPQSSFTRFMQSFGLTPAEQRLTSFLATGGCLGAAADTFGLSRHTVRNQLRSVFGKVGVQRQADLTRLMLAGCAC